MITFEPLTQLPGEIQRVWGARLQQAERNHAGVFRLVAARGTKPRSFEEQRVVVLVIDENGFPLPNIRVAFSYSTAEPYVLTPDFS